MSQHVLELELNKPQRFVLKQPNKSFTFSECQFRHMVSVQSTLCIANSCNNTQQDNKIQPKANAFTKIKMLLTAQSLKHPDPDLSWPSSSRSSKSHSFSHIMKWPNSFQIQREYLAATGPNKRWENWGQHRKIKPTAAGRALLRDSFFTSWDWMLPPYSPYTPYRNSFIYLCSSCTNSISNVHKPQLGGRKKKIAPFVGTITLSLLQPYYTMHHEKAADLYWDWNISKHCDLMQTETNVLMASIFQYS